MRLEDAGISDAHRKGLDAVRMLMKQKAQIRRRAMLGGDRQKHMSRARLIEPVGR
jgi:hypothetical protein